MFGILFLVTVAGMPSFKELPVKEFSPADVLIAETSLATETYPTATGLLPSNQLFCISPIAAKKVVVHTFLRWSQARLLRQPSCGNYRSHNFFVLGRILMKFHIQTWLIESFPTTFWLWWCAEESGTSHQFTPYAN